jgi:hypothetical protein
MDMVLEFKNNALVYKKIAMVNLLNNVYLIELVFFIGLQWPEQAPSVPTRPDGLINLINNKT